MSAFQVSPEHINYLAVAAHLYHVATDPQALAEQLAAENAKSIEHAYPHHGPCEPVPVRWSLPRRRIEPIQVIKAAECYRYQSCEHPEWAESDAARVIDHLISAAIGKLPGYDEAEWEIVD